MSAETKASLRADRLAQRRTLTNTERHVAALAAAQAVFPVPISDGTIVAGYWPIRGELDPRPVMAALAVRGAVLALPSIASQDAPLIFRAWQSQDEMRRGALGIDEPLPEAAIVTPDIVLVPLSVFDRRGHRIGYGAGHYDRALGMLRRHRRIVAIGIAFAVQETRAVPNEPHDVPLDFVLTEREVIACRSE